MTKTQVCRVGIPEGLEFTPLQIKSALLNIHNYMGRRTYTKPPKYKTRQVRLSKSTIATLNKVSEATGAPITVITACLLAEATPHISDPYDEREALIRRLNDLGYTVTLELDSETDTYYPKEVFQ